MINSNWIWAVVNVLRVFSFHEFNSLFDPRVNVAFSGNLFAKIGVVELHNVPVDHSILVLNL